MMIFSNTGAGLMKRLLISAAVFAFAACSYAQEGQSLGDVARQNQEQKKAKHTLTNEDISGSDTDSGTAAQPVAAPAGDSQAKDDSPAKADSATAQSSDDTSTDATKPDRSNFVGDMPGVTQEPKDRIATLKQHASQWDSIVTNLEKKIAAEKDPEKRDGLETMLDHARQNQAKDAAEQSKLEKSEAEKDQTEEGGSSQAPEATQGEAAK
jgi:hypothetical protein